MADLEDSISSMNQAKALTAAATHRKLVDSHQQQALIDMLNYSNNARAFSNTQIPKSQTKDSQKISISVIYSAFALINPN
ncbi:hypothetical protein TKK_0000981 [Trichogramma kaykai]